MLDNYLSFLQKNLFFNCKTLTGGFKESSCVLIVEAFKVLIMLKSEVHAIEEDIDV